MCEFFLIALPFTEVDSSKAKQNLSKSWGGRGFTQFLFDSCTFPHYFPSDIHYFIYLCTYVGIYTYVYVYVCTRVCMCIIRFVSRPPFSRDAFNFKVVITLVPFALQSDFSKAGQCQSCKPLPCLCGSLFDVGAFSPPALFV